MKRNKYATLAIVVGLAAAVMLAQILVGQAPAPRARACAAGAPGQAPGGAPGAPGGRGGAWLVVAVAAAGEWRSCSSGRSCSPHCGWETRLHRILERADQDQHQYGSAAASSIRKQALPDGKIPYKPDWEERATNENKNHLYNEPYTHCLPAGVPTNFGIQMGFQAVQDKNAIVFGWDTGGATRVIYLDGRKHLHPNIKLYQGDSIGKFEGDVLTVDTTNQMAGWWDANGAIHSDQVHVVEKFTFRDSNTIGYEALVTDPVALTRPMTVTDTFTRNVNVPWASVDVPVDSSRPHGLRTDRDRLRRG